MLNNAIIQEFYLFQDTTYHNLIGIPIQLHRCVTLSPKPSSKEIARVAQNDKLTTTRNTEKAELKN